MKIQSNRIIVFIFFAISLIVSHVQGQDATQAPSKYYIKGSLGVGGGINGQYNENTDNNYNVTNTLSTVGNGINAMASAGYQLNNHLGFELGLGYIYGFQNNITPPSDGNFYKATGYMWQMVPSVVFSAPSFGNFTPYLRTGLLLGLPTIFTDAKATDNSQFNNPVVEEKFKIYNGLSVGLQSAIGCAMPLKNSNCSIFAEAVFNSISFIPQRASMYYYTENGTDMFSSQPESSKELIFKQNGSLLPYPNPSQPSVQPYNQYAFGALSLNIGIKMNIGNLSAPIVNDDAQKHLYARINLGYGFTTDGDMVYDVNDTLGAKAIRFSGGNGFNAGLGAGYMLNSNLGFDLGLNYVSGNTIKTSYNQFGTGLFIPGFSSVTGHGPTSSIYGNMFMLNPSIVFATQIQKFKPYARFGMLLGFGTAYTTTDLFIPDSITNSGNESIHYKLKYYGGISLGFNSTLGVAYPINDKFDIYTEACFNTIYDVPQKAQYIEATENGVDVLNSSNSSKDIVFESSYNYNKVNNDPTKPQVESSVKFSFNTVVASVGIRMWLR